MDAYKKTYGYTSSCKPFNAGALAGSVLGSLNYLSRKTTSRRQKTKEKEKYANLLLIYSENQQALGGLANVARKWHIFLHTFLVLRLSHLTIWQETVFWITSTEGSGLSSKLSKITKIIVFDRKKIRVISIWKHIYQFMGEKSHVITIFFRKFKLNQHIALVHEVQKPFKCDIFDYIFSVKGGMKKHVA